jgi:hypothetical protein
MYSFYSMLMIIVSFCIPLSSVWSEPTYGCDGHMSHGMSSTRQKHGDYDCLERMDTGYVSGDAFPIMVVTVDGEPAERESANAYWVMKQAALLDGIDLHISSGFRTWAEQEYFYNCYLNQNCNNGNLAAPPGYSNHQSGHAFDLNTSVNGVLTWLNNNGARFGFERTVSSEPWHWEWWGGGPGGGPCQGQPCQIISADGGVLDDSGPCFQKFGPMTYWRQVNDEGEEGGLHWTNAFDAVTPDNWARWNIHLSEAGEYLVEVSVSTQYGLCTQTPYLVKHGANEVAVTLDQSTLGYWQPLGIFSFDIEEAQYVDIYDNIPGWSLQNQHITADAIRLTRQRASEPNPEPAGEEVETDPMTSDDAGNMYLAGTMVGETAGSSNENGGDHAGQMVEEHSAGMQNSGESTAGMILESTDNDALSESSIIGGGFQNEFDLENDESAAQGGMSCAQLNRHSLTHSYPLLFSLLTSLLFSLTLLRCCISEITTID